jgi:putative lipoprotein
MNKQAFNSGMVGAVMCSLAACSPNGPVQSEPVWTPQALLGSQWIDAGPLVGQTPVSLEFASDARISGHAGCNQYMGKAEISGTSVRLTHNAATRMFCIPQEVMDSENRFWEALSQTRSAQKEQGLLLLVDESGKVLWRFKPRG